MGWASYVPILVFVGRIGQHVSDASRHVATLEVMALVGDTVLRVSSVSCTKFDMHRPTRSENNMTHFLSQD